MVAGVTVLEDSKCRIIFNIVSERNRTWKLCNLFHKQINIDLRSERNLHRRTDKKHVPVIIKALF